MNRTAKAMAMLLGVTVLAWAGAAQATRVEPKAVPGPKPAVRQEAQAKVHSHVKCELHGGQVSMTKQHHFETVFAPDGIRVYFYTEGQSPLQVEKAKGNVTLTFKDGKKKAVPLDANTPAAGEKTVYFCPMHADVVQMQPGLCPKCGGMKLFTQDRLFAPVDLSKVAPGTMEAAINITGLDGPETDVAFFESYDKRALPVEGMKPAGPAVKGAQKTDGAH